MSHKHNSFTLIELLVVISIIGLLSSIIVVSLKESRERAKTASVLEFSSQVYHTLGSDAVGVWNFNEGSLGQCSGGEDICDISGYGNHGTLQGGVTWNSDTPSHQGHSLEFNGSNGYIEVGTDDSLDIINEFTYEAWVNGPDPGGAEIEIYDRGVGRTTLGLHGSGGWDNSPFLKINWIQYSLLNSFQNYWGKWTHIVATFNDPTDTVRIFINGEKVYENTGATAVVPSGTFGKAIGAITGGGNYFDGLIDDVRIYSCALTSFEIQQHYVQGKISHPLATE